MLDNMPVRNKCLLGKMCTILGRCNTKNNWSVGILEGFMLITLSLIRKVHVGILEVIVDR